VVKLAVSSIDRQLRDEPEREFPTHRPSRQRQETAEWLQLFPELSAEIDIFY